MQRSEGREELVEIKEMDLSPGSEMGPKREPGHKVIVYTRDLQFYSKSIGKPLKDFMQWSDKQLDVYL